MTTYKHTPGPWAIEHDGPALPIITAPATTSAGKIMTDVIAHAKGDNAEANARLCASAPELLEALEWAIEALDDNRLDQVAVYLEFKGREAIAKAHAAIAKAKDTGP